MEKLKAKHDHKLTDILKVFIFGLFLIMPFLVFAPALLYISFNQNAQAEETTINVDEYKQVDFNQKFTFEQNFSYDNGTLNVNATSFHFEYESNNNENDKVVYANSGEINTNDILIVKFEYISNINFRFQGIYQSTELLSTNSYTIYQDRGNMLEGYSSYYWYNYDSISSTWTLEVKNIQTFNLTQMFGAGNEPTIQQFNEWYTKDYYNYTLTKPEVLKISTTTETIQDVETQIANNWQQMWNKQIFKWTNETILYKGINAFSQTFGIFDNSYITNLITYELIIVMIYIVIDIILTMFKWLTHMIGEK